MLVVAIMFGIALVTFSEYMGLAIKDPETVQAAVFIPLLPLIFTSSAFAPISRLPGWMQPVARVNPVTSAIDTARGLVLGDDALYKVSQVHLSERRDPLRDRLGGDHGPVHVPRRAPVSEGLNRLQSARSRVVFALTAGAITVLACRHGSCRGRSRPWPDGTSPRSSVLLRVWSRIWYQDAAQTREWATLEDNTRPGSELLLLGAGVASLVGVGFAFLKAEKGGGSLQVLLEAMGITTIVLSWLIVHTTFALRYAHLYYTDAAGGIDFKQGRDYEPDYRDFAYTAFTVGMTYQVSDTDITKREIRHTVLRHALLSFVFGAVIIGATVNIVAGLLNN